METNKFEDVIKEVKGKVVKRLKNKEQLMILLTPKQDDDFIRVEISRFRVEPPFADMEIRTNLALDFIVPKTNKDFAMLLTCLLTDKIEKITGEQYPSYLLENIEKAFIDGKLNEVYDFYKTFVENNIKEQSNGNKGTED